MAVLTISFTCDSTRMVNQHKGYKCRVTVIC